MDLKALSDVFSPDDIEWRIQSSGKKSEKIWALALAYITNRAIMNRLDEVCGPENWQNQFAPGPLGGVVCGISIKIGDEWVCKWDGADETDIEKIKGGLSGAMKRAGVQWGIGRYLYNLDATWAVIGDKGQFSAKTKDGTWFKWSPPALPLWALPTGAKATGGRAAEITPESDETPAPAQTREPDPKPEQPGTLTARGIIDDVVVKIGTTKGKEWTRYGVRIGGVFYGSFSHTVGESAQSCQGAEVVISYTSDGDRNTIVELVPVATK